VSESPLAQFEIHPVVPLHLFGYDVSFTNSSLLMLLAVVLSLALLIGGGARGALVPGRLQSLAEMFYEFIANMVMENCGTAGMRYMPWIFTIFMFVLFGNLLGLEPWSFTFTSHIIVTFTLAMMVFVFVTILAFARHGVKFFGFFLPPGVPIWLWWLIIPIEIISYLSRPISLSVRLFTNMFAGHMLMVIVSGFAVAIGAWASASSIGPLGALLGAPLVAFNVVMMLFELLVAVLQAYVFAILTALYLKDALELHH
jgi:F-type H+-transporting ATPase subunit a